MFLMFHGAIPCRADVLSRKTTFSKTIFWMGHGKDQLNKTKPLLINDSIYRKILKWWIIKYDKYYKVIIKYFFFSWLIFWMRWKAAYRKVGFSSKNELWQLRSNPCPVVGWPFKPFYQTHDNSIPLLCIGIWLVRGAMVRKVAWGARKPRFNSCCKICIQLLDIGERKNINTYEIFFQKCKY